MIGNDIVDLAKARYESHIFRPGYFQKTCTDEEISTILSSNDAFRTFWRIWTMKETAYKAFQRRFNFQPVLNPIAFSAKVKNADLGTVSFQGYEITVKTIQHQDFIYSEIIHSDAKQRFFGLMPDFLLRLKSEFGLHQLPTFVKSTTGFPMVKLMHNSIPISRTHHGNFEVFQY